MDHVCQFTSKSIHLFTKYVVHKFGNGQTDRQTNGQVEYTMSLSTSLACKRYEDQAHSQPSDNGGRFRPILDLFQGLIIGSSQWLSRGNLDF